MGYVDKKGNIVINPSFEPYLSLKDYKPLDYPSQYNWLIYQQLGNEGIVAVAGTPEYSDVSAWALLNRSAFSDDLALVRVGDKYGYIEILKGDISIAPQFEDAASFNQGLAAVKAAGLWGYISPKGETVITPIFENAFDFSEGLAAVKSGEKWGFIDSQGDFVVDPQFDFAGRYHNGLAWVEKDGSGGYIDEVGRYVWPEAQRNGFTPTPTLLSSIPTPLISSPNRPPIPTLPTLTPTLPSTPVPAQPVEVPTETNQSGAPEQATLFPPPASNVTWLPTYTPEVPIETPLPLPPE
jgi:hypothetical protein